ncbi:uncharacterized protein [Mytilus edulis]|uniref:uncharacterized protein isoform X2 n=1 Tax=Mytilus edulis TaxID=6550 RepID=UPI0039F00CE7
MYATFTTDSVLNRRGFYGVYSVDCPHPGFNEYTNVPVIKNYHYRDIITVKCKPGYSFNSDSIKEPVTMTCLFGGTWDMVIPKCQPLYCGLPPNITDGYYHNSTGVIYESEVRYKCFPGFYISSSDAITCDNSGSWSKPPSCIAATCKTAPDVVNAIRTVITGDLTSYASIIQYDCNDGFELFGEPILFCRSDNTWSATPPSCKKLKCLLPEIKNGKLSKSTFPEFKEEITVKCDVGFRLNGTKTLTCNENQTYEELPTCDNIDECIEGTSNCDQKCVDNIGSYTCHCNLGYSPDVKQKCKDIRECDRDDRAGCDHMCKDVPGGYQCGCKKTGYQLFTKDFAANFTVPLVMENGNLGKVYNLDHTCVRKLCPSPPSIDNGMLMTHRSVHQYGDTIQYFCNIGYVMNGKKLFTCDSTGQWSPSRFPKCQAYSYTYVGCYHDDTDPMFDEVHEKKTLSAEICFTQCTFSGWKSDQYFATQAGNKCYCGNGTQLGSTKYTKRTERECNMACVGNTKEICGGIWRSSVYRITPGVCLVDPYKTHSLIRQPTSVSPDVSVEFGDTLNMNCTVPGKGDFTKERKCIYNMTSDSYYLYGNDYECGEIDCGNPPSNITGANFTYPSNLKYGSMFEFSCSSLFYVDGKSVNGSSDIEVICGADGQWDLGSLQCLGETCSDPGYPAGGIATLMMNNTFQSFQKNGHISFSCDRAGFVPDTLTKISCNENISSTSLNWDNQVPSCIDVMKPVFSGCPDNITVKAYSKLSLHFTQPNVSDNSGSIKEFTIEPVNANSTLTVDRTPFTVKYIAKDHADNEEICTFEVFIEDEKRPKIQNCPRSRIEYVDSTSHNITSVVGNKIVVTDNIDNVNAVVTPETFIADASNPTRQIVNVKATDKAGNTDECYFEIYVRVSMCSPYYLPTPQHGSKSCTPKTGDTGYECNITCSSGYYMYDYPDQSLVTMECDNGGGWNRPIISACTQGYIQANFTQTFDITYNGVSNITENCTSDYQNAIEALIPSPRANIQKACTALFPTMVVELSIASSSVNITSDELMVKFTMTIGPAGFTTDQYKACANLTEVHMVNSSISSVTDLSGCPNISAESNLSSLSFTQVSTCNGSRKYGEIDGKDFCLACPEGTYITDQDTCDLCPVGTYNSLTEVSTCISCPDGTTSYTKGNVFPGSCTVLSCSSGHYSISGFPPCLPCPLDTYFVNSTTCEKCPINTETEIRGAVNQTQCKSKCPSGQYNIFGHEPSCRLCPLHYYQPKEGAIDCIECDNDKITLSNGTDNSSDCLDAEPILCKPDVCQRGNCSIRYHVFFCQCPEGYYGRHCEMEVNHCLSEPCYNNGTCTSTPTSYTCDCLNGTTGARCETDDNSECTNSTCINGGVCINKINSFTCICPVKYKGPNCEMQTDICEVKPCLNKARCENYNNVRRKCVCQPGFTGVDCETNIEECDSNPCYNDATCEDRVNGYFCQCKTGYSGTRCEVRTSPCVDCKGGTCVDDYRADSYRCVCKEGVSYGEFCDFKLHVNTLPSVSLEGAASTNENYSASECRSTCDNALSSCGGFVYQPTDKICYILKSSLIGIEMSSNSSYDFYVHRCIRPVDDFYTPWFNTDSPNTSMGDQEKIKTLTGKYGMNICGGTKPVGAECRVFNKTLTYHYETGDTFSLACGIEGLKCESNPKNPCEDYEVRYRCSANKVFKGRPCTDLLYCDYNDSPCQNGATCFNQAGGFHCNCKPGYTGSLCQHNIDDCPSVNQCLNGGKCRDILNGHECDCPEGYTGSICQNNKPDCYSGACSNRGTCIDGVNTYTCQCFDGFTGSNCSMNIDDCAINPCLHGGECQDGQNDFLCSCPTGWTGTRCENIIDLCERKNPCPSSANCSNLFNDYYCRCPEKTYGKLCENSLDTCRDVNPCINEGECDNAALPNCDCNDDYTGKGCQTLVNHCAEKDTCKNGGTCQTSANGVGFKCHCKTGFSGDKCETNIDNCKAAKCPVTSVCRDMVNDYYCRCNLGLTGEYCTRELDTNYDLLFYLPARDGYAALPYPIELTGSGITISMWVKFQVNGFKQIYFTLYSVSALNSLENREEMIMFHNMGVDITDHNGKKTIAQNYFTIDNGEWHNVVFTWDEKSGGKYIINSISQGTNTAINFKNNFNHNIWIVIGDNLGPITKQSTNEGFKGYISQLNIYNRALDFETEIAVIHSKPQVVFIGAILRWNEFILHKGVQPVYPSHASREGCVLGKSCITQVINKRPPSIVNCPSDLHIYSKERLITVSWTEPTIKGASTINRRYRSGDTFLWGKYKMIYEAIDDESNSQFCSFNIYVQSEVCNKVPDPWGGVQLCEKHGSNEGCTIRCTNSKTERISRYHPLLYTCGPSGSWNPAMPSHTLTYPPCGPINGFPKKRLDLVLSYPNITTANCPGVKEALEVEVKMSVQKINAYWDSKLCTEADCSDITVVVDCGTLSDRRKRAVSITNVQLTIPKSLKNLKDLTINQEVLSAEDVIRREVLDSNYFDFSSQIPGGELDTSGFILTSTDVCGDTETVIDGYCVKCGPGTFLNTTTKICESCPIGTYTTSDGQTQCQECPAGSTTETEGLNNPSYCYSVCPAGQKYDKDDSKCEDCGLGYYQEKEGQFYCEWCGLGKTTRETNTTSVSLCYDVCLPGKQLSASGSCVDCPEGTYKNVGAKCIACPPGTTTLTTGASLQKDCNIKACEAGYKRVGTDTCEKCPIGTYQPQKWQTSCLSCGGDSYRTDQEASTSQDDCKYFCPSGYEAVVTSCVPCLEGFFKDNTDSIYGKCKQCPYQTTTVNIASKSLKDCSVFNCPPGYKSDTLGTRCEICPLGTYQPHHNETTCYPCSTPLSTEQTGSTAIQQCLNYCPPGQERHPDGLCYDCGIGFYKHNNNNYFMPCTACPDEYTTFGAKSTSISQCTMRKCMPGSMRKDDNTGCTPCPTGTYQDLPYQTSCKQCPEYSFSRREGAFSITQCESYCDPGYEKDSNNQCSPCGIGYYKNNDFDKFLKCTPCPVDRITPSIGSISISQCTRGNCLPGYRIERSGCQICPIGSYQSLQWQDECIPCPLHKSTVFAGSTDYNDCIFSCDPGYEDSFGGCFKCQIGYFKSEKRAISCTKCPNGMITSDFAATSFLDCNIPDCPAGYKIVNRCTNTNCDRHCEVCGYDYYQPSTRQHDCIPCGIGYTTFELQNAQTRLHCKLDCASGSEIHPLDPLSCRTCAIGYYRDSSDRRIQSCQLCPLDFITAEIGATNINACTIKNCTQHGTYRNSINNRCTACPVGTYNHLKWQDSCTQCPDGYTTTSTGSDNVNSCIRDCPSGYEHDGSLCRPCPVGKYRDKGTSGFLCQSCINGYTTAKTASISSSMCNQSPCNLGEYLNTGTNQCDKCALDYYQDQNGGFNCKLCPNGKYTEQIGSVNLGACRSYCDDGNKNNCTANSICQDNVVSGFICVCIADHVIHKGVCKHKCDTGYCSHGTCNRSPLSCSCPEEYIGTTCNTRRSSSGWTRTEKIIAGTVAGGVGLLIIIIFIVCCFTMPWRNDRMPSPHVQKVDIDDNVNPYSMPVVHQPLLYHDRDVDRVSLFNIVPVHQPTYYDNYFGGTGQRGQLHFRDPLPEYMKQEKLQLPDVPVIYHDNATYSTAQPAVYIPKLALKDSKK